MRRKRLIIQLTWFLFCFQLAGCTTASRIWSEMQYNPEAARYVNGGDF